MSSSSTSILPLDRRKPPAILRIANSLYDLLPFELIGTSEKAIMRLAELTTRLSDWGDDAYLNRLRAQCASIEQSKLTMTGRFGYRVVLHWHAVNRLRQVEFLKRHPEALEEKFEKPIFILGGYRTGTTHLHTLLSQDPGLRMPRAWEVSFPIPKSKDLARADKSRRRAAKTVFAMNQFIMPDQKEVHAVLLDGPEECHFLLENTALSMTQYIAFLGYQYADWLLTQDNQSAYDDLRKQYQILAYLDRKQHGPSVVRPWVLKCPLHTWYTRELMQAFPDGRFIWTHRPMASTIPSTCGLTAVTATKFFKEVDGASVGPFYRDYYIKGFERALTHRDSLPSDPFFDVRLKDLSREPLPLLEELYQAIDQPFTAEARARISSHVEAENRRRKEAKKHHYSLEEFGLNASEIDEHFGAYEKRFGLR